MFIFNMKNFFHPTQKNNKICSWNLDLKFYPNQFSQHRKVTFKTCISLSRLLTADLKQLIESCRLIANDLVNRFSCNIESAGCMKNSCESYPKYHANGDNFVEDFESSTDTVESDSSTSGNHTMKCYKWMTTNGKASKVMVS